MPSGFGSIRRSLLGIPPSEVLFARRGFSNSREALRERLEGIGTTFVAGYHAALERPAAPHESAALRLVPDPDRGFAFEGAGMGLALLDVLTPWRRDRLHRFLRGAGEPHTYMVIIGAGWALARLRRPVDAWLGRLDPILGWLLLDGYGFHEGYFHWPVSVEGQRVPRRLRGYARRGFDQGLGRSLWFVRGAEVDRIAATLSAFQRARHRDLWSGVGLACAYAGGVARADIEVLREASGEHAPALAQGVAFAAKARARAGIPTRHTELACEVLCGAPADVAAKTTDEALVGARDFEDWRGRIRRRFGGRE